MKLYYSSPYLSSWATKVKDIFQKDQEFIVTLEETAFYPEGGGQPADTGYINDIEVIDVYSENGEVYHKLPHPPLSNEVQCQLDWNRRLDHMQQHTGQHILSAVCIDLFDAHTSSFHLGKEIVSIDLSIPELTESQLLQIEQQVNQYIYENHDITTFFVTKEELSSLPLRKQPDIDEDIRIVQIGNIDTSACAGTHVSKTGELGILKLLKTEKSKGNTRVYFKCGWRALHDYQETHTVLTAVAANYSTNREGLLDKITKLDNEIKQLQKQIDTLKTENNHFIANELIKNHKEKIIKQEYPDKTLKELQGISSHLTELTSSPILLITLLENKLLLTHNGSMSIHCGQLFKEELSRFNGKGGGNKNSAQASFQNVNELEAFKQYVMDSLNDYM
ncbi:alanyl-tRNA editing protein [Ferdinandcohnia quinoae]|uniref:DHHA1 domain-containing protein n=1 Tax=Fredinandcohnia quinoae TaxID=2918902 RepID=A0AAW5E981_9BACI|nr:DHHA1 domain-containing protein [Fredinandcohnia sp. SECRCQ15]